MSDTPETDAAVLASEGQWSFVLKETCQKLERERNKATEDATNYYARLGEVEKERDEAREKYRTAVSNQKRESFRLHREIKDLSRELDAIRAVFKNKANDKNWEPGETLAETGARVLRERDEAIADRDILRIDAQREAEHHDRMVSELEKVYKERDEAREEAAKWEQLYKSISVY